MHKQIQQADLSQLLSDKNYIIAADEVGYGALCGNVVVCGVKVLKDWHMDGLKDSKKLSPKRRQSMQEKLLAAADKQEIRYHIAERTNNQIDQVGIRPALLDCFVEVFRELYATNSLIIVDGNIKFNGLGVDHLDIVSLIKADNIVDGVKAASIIAKVYRDNKMKELDHQFPVYDWKNNMGYGSDKHLSALKEHGYSPLHRTSYEPIKSMCIK